MKKLEGTTFVVPSSFFITIPSFSKRNHFTLLIHLETIFEGRIETWS